MKKKWFGMMIALALCLGLCPIGVFATEGEPDGANVPAPIDDPPANALAKVDVGGTTTYPTTEAEFLAAFVAGNSGATVTLLKSVNLGSDRLVIPDNTEFTLEGGTYELTSSDGAATVAVGKRSTFTLQSGILSNTSALGVTVLLDDDGSAFTMSGGTVNSTYIAVSCGISDVSVNISGGKVIGGTIGLSASAGTVKLSGGTYSSIYVNGKTAADILADGCALQVGDRLISRDTSLSGRQNDVKVVNPCPHTGALEDKGNGTHGGDCPYCGTKFEAATHTLGADNKCEGCGTELKVQVEIGNATTYYGEIGPAWTAACAAESATVTLLDDVTASVGLTVSSGNITLNGGKFTLTGPSNNSVIIIMSGGKLTITGGVIKTGVNNLPNSTSAVAATNGELVVTGGTLEAGTNAIGLRVGQTATVELSGGTFYGIAVNDTVGRLLLHYGSTVAAEKHYAYYRDGGPIALADDSGTLSGTVKVQECDHTGVDPTANNDGTHSRKCPYCGYTGPAGDCSYGTEYQHDDTNHWKTCTVCGYENKAAHSWMFAYNNSAGNVTENYQLCINCRHTKDHLTLTITVPTGLTYGDTGDKQVTYTLSPEIVCDKVTWTFIDGDRSEFAGGVLPANLPVGTHSFRVNGFMSDTTVFSGSYYITVAPKPLTVTGVTAAGRDYDGTNEVAITAVALDGVVAGDTVSVDLTGLKGTIPGSDAGAYTSVTLPKTMKLTGAAAGNYTLTQPTGALAASVTIGKADYTGAKAANTSTKFGAAAAYDLTALLPAGATAGTPTTASDIFDGTPGVSGKTLSYALKADAAVGGTGAITVPVTSTNYKDFNLTITVTVADKDVPALTVSPITVTYSGEAVPDSAIRGTAKVGNTTVTGAWSFAPGQLLANAADSGTKTVIFKPTDTAKYAEATGTVAVTINKATPSGMPTYTAISTGGKTLTDAALTAPAGWPAGTLTWELPGTTEVAANTAYRWTFTPDNANYNTLSGSITLWQRSTGGGSGSGGSSGGSGGSGSTALPVTTTGQNSSAVTTTTTAAPSASTQNGTASATVDTSMGNEIVKQAVANKSENVVIAPKVTGSVTRAEVSIPASTVWQIRSQTNASLTIATPVANVTIPNGGLGSLSGTSGTVIVTAEKTGNHVELTVTADGRTVTSVPGGLTLTVPAYTTPGTVAVLVHDNGMREVVRKSVAHSGSLTIPLDGSAKLEIVDNSKYFADVPSTSWAADAVAFASSHELFNGTGTNQFSPNLLMSRGMLATVLHNLESNPYQPISGVFADVNNGAWYAEGVAWAAANGIVTGYGNGQFGPNDNITREQLAVMLWRYAGSPAAVGSELRFADAYRASDWALEALRWAIQNGIINGKGNGILDPTGQATRAETAQMLKNFMERR